MRAIGRDQAQLLARYSKAAVLEVTAKTEIQRLAAYALIIKNGKILLCRLTNQTGSEGMWTLPGGKVEFGEHPDSAVVREVLEETGLQISLQGVLAVNSELFNFPDSRMHAIRLIYRVRVDGGKISYEKDGTTDVCDWFSLHETRRLPLVSLAKTGVKLARENGWIR